MTALYPSFHSLRTLSSVSDKQIELLRKLGITNLGDLIAYQPFRYAQFVLAAKNQLLRKDEILSYLDEAVRKKNLVEILESPLNTLKDIGSESAVILNQLGMITIADVARFDAFSEAEEIITRSTTDDSDPFAPACVLPTCKKFTRNIKSYVSFFKQEEIRDLSIIPSRSANSLIANLFRFRSSETKIIHLGYSVSYLQEWIFRGVHLGEPQGSVNLFMGQDTQVSVLDWRRAISAFRFEDTRITERLSSTLFHQRAVDEVARATAEEHQQGATSSFGANAATAGSFVAAGAVVGGLGGGISGALAGLVLGNVANVAGGAPTLAGATVGTAVGSLAGAAAGSLIFSGATTLGFVETDAEGDREIFASSAQNIQQRTVQNSSSLRSFWSNIINQSVEDEQQQIRTNRVTNHNRIHALNALYFEVLNEYQVNMRVNSFAPIIFIPYKPLFFTEDILRRYWWLIRTFLNDPSLVLALDQHFLALSSDPSAGSELAALPEIDDIKSNRIDVEVNLDEPALRLIIKDLVSPPFLDLALEVFQQVFLTEKRKNIEVSIVTSAGAFELTCDFPSNTNNDPNFVGKYSTTDTISLHTIESVNIRNENLEFKIEGPGFSCDLTELAFEDISAAVKIKNKSSFGESLPNLGALEGKQTIQATTLKVGGNRSKTVAWNIADRLRAQFEGVNESRAALETELANEEATSTKIANLLGFLNANKFGFTRLILQNTEAEQLVNILEGVQVGGVDLNEFAGTTPLGFCGNHMVLPLKKCSVSGENHDPLSIDVTKLRLQLMWFENLDLAKPKEVINYIASTKDFLDQFLQRSPAQIKSARDRELITRIHSLKTQIDSFIADISGFSVGGRGSRFAAVLLRRLLERVRVEIQALLAFINAPIQTNSTDMSRLCGFYASVRKTLKPRIGELISTTEVSLPSPAVFMEPVLSNAKGAELYDMRRNSHYEILPAPGIAAADPNTLRARDIALTPNVPPATLTIQSAPELPLPTSLAAVLGEAGKLNLGTLIQSNAASLTSMLSNLSTMATELAKASSTLTGDAQKQAIASATDVAKQVGDIVSKSLQLPSGEATAPPPMATPSPQTQQQKAEVERRVREIDASPSSLQQKKEQKKTIGAATTPDGPPLVTSALFSFIFNTLRGTELGSLFRLEMRKDGLAITVDGSDTQLSQTTPSVQPLDFSETGLSQFPVRFENNGSPVLLSLFGDVQTFGVRIDFKKTSAFALPENLSNYLFEIVPENEEIRVTAASKFEAEAALKGEIDFDIEVGGAGASSGGNGGAGGGVGATANARKPKLNKTPKLLDKLKNVPTSLPGLFFALAKEVVLPPVTATAGASGSAGGSVSGSGSVNVEGTFVFQIPTGDFRIDFLADRSR